MGYRLLEDIDNRILRAIMKIGAAEGAQRVTAKKIAAECGISTFTIYEHFGTMRGAQDAAARAFDRLYMEQASALAQAHLPLEEIWDQMLERLLQDSDGALYYISYINCFGFDPTSANDRAEEFLAVAKLFFHTKPHLSDSQYLLLWDYITSMVFYYMEKFLHYMAYNQENRAMVRQLLFSGMDRFGQ